MDQSQGDLGNDLRNRIGLLYETHVATRLEHLGYEVQRTPVTGDGGADLVVFVPTSEWTARRLPAYVVQCKAWEGPVGMSAVQEVYTGRALADGDYALLIVSSDLTPEARKAAQSLGVLTARLALSGDGELPVPPATEYVVPRGRETLSVDEIRRLAIAAAADALYLTPEQRQRWHAQCADLDLRRNAAGMLVYRVTVQLDDPPALWGAPTRHELDVDLDAHTGVVTMVSRRGGAR